MLAGNNILVEKDMNYIDKQFYKLTNEIKSLTFEELFERNELFKSMFVAENLT